MRITVKFGDPLWRKFGARRLEVSIDQGSVTAADVLARLAEQYPAAGADILPDGQSAQERLPYHLFVNHRKIPWDQSDKTFLQDGDQVVLFLIVVGG